MSLFELRDVGLKIEFLKQYVISTPTTFRISVFLKISMFLLTQKGRQKIAKIFHLLNKVPKYFVVLILVTVTPFRVIRGILSVVYHSNKFRALEIKT